MKNLNRLLNTALLAIFAMLTIVACSDDDPTPEPPLTGDQMSYTLMSVDNSGVMGNATFAKREDGATILTIALTGTAAGGSHPSHIHFNTAAEGGDIAVSLSPVDGATGESITVIEELADGSAVTYEELLDFDGYINVHASADDLATLVAQGDIGQNMLTGTSMSYNLNDVDDPNISGTATFAERANGETLVTVMLTDNSATERPGHIHMGNAAEGGGIAVTLSNTVMGMGKTNVASLDDGSSITYADLIMYDGYINIHASANDLATLVAQGDIGQNMLTGNSETYDLNDVSDPNISGTATFAERANGETLVTVMLSDNSMTERPGHIHMNTAVEGGGIAVTLSNTVMGMGKTNIAALNDGTAITYDELIMYDGYINIHASANDLATLVAQGDIGQNALTGESKAYELGEKDVAGISGTFTVYERVNGESLAIVELQGTVAGGSHPGHIHMNAAVEGGGIAYTFAPVDGATGKSMNNISMLDDGTAITYTELLDYNGYVNIHLSANDLTTLVAQGDIGSNELTGQAITYDLEERDQTGTSGTITFMERKDGTSLAKIELSNTIAGDSHPGHIHENSAAQGGGILFTFNQVDGTTGTSMTNVRMLDDGTAITYSEIQDFNGYVNIHKDVNDLATLVAQGNIGSNAN